jgi:hypothetical protein
MIICSSYKNFNYTILKIVQVGKKYTCKCNLAFLFLPLLFHQHKYEAQFQKGKGLLCLFNLGLKVYREAFITGTSGYLQAMSHVYFQR